MGLNQIKESQITAFYKLCTDFNLAGKFNVSCAALKNLKIPYYKYIHTYLLEKGYIDKQNKKLKPVYVGQSSLIWEDFKLFAKKRTEGNAININKQQTIKKPFKIIKNTKETFVETGFKNIPDKKQILSLCSLEEIFTELRLRGFKGSVTQTKEI